MGTLNIKPEKGLSSIFALGGAELKHCLSLWQAKTWQRKHLMVIKIVHCHSDHHCYCYVCRDSCYHSPYIVRTLVPNSYSCPGLALSALDSFHVGNSILLGMMSRVKDQCIAVHYLVDHLITNFGCHIQP